MNSWRISFENTTFPGIPQVAEILALPSSVRRSLFEEGVPEHFFYRGYSADPDLSVFRAERRSLFVRFGSDSCGIIGIDCASGNVIHVSSGLRERVAFVNATPGGFTETARILAQEFPYGTSGELEESHLAADRMRAIIWSVDSEAAAPGNYWPNYADEVDGWMYGMDEIVEWYRKRRPIPPVADFSDPRQSGIESADDRLF
jgi:hypothetical protein